MFRKSMMLIALLVMMAIACNMPGIGANSNPSAPANADVTQPSVQETLPVITAIPLPSQTTEMAPIATQPTLPTIGEPTAWNKQKIELFKIEMDLPDGWTIQEINRRPEPTAQEAPAVGHDCADYFLVDPSQLVKLSISPACGFMTGGSEPWPEDAVTVKEKAENSYIIRYFDEKRAMFWYSDGGKGNLQSEEGTKEVKLRPDPPMINIGNDQTFLLVIVQFQYMGNKPEEQQKALEITDKIVSSLTIYP